MRAAILVPPLLLWTGLLRRLEPAVEAVLQLLGSDIRRIGAVDDVGRFNPGLVFEVRRAARQDLVSRANRRLVRTTPRDEFLGERIGHLYRRRVQAEEARQRVGIDVG